MADDAFALSPISARASLPTEADYDAICGAFMETARGRWFLGEYAKRNRNADTRLVLDAVERIEATLATQKVATQTSLADLLPEIAGLIVDARQRILDALPKTDIRPSTEPIQRAGSVLRDVAWTLRESGADTRVCDLLDVQAKAIVDACARMHGDQAIAPDIPATVTQALESLTRQISSLIKTEAPAAAPQPRAHVDAETAAEARRDEPPAAPTQAAAPPPVVDIALDVVAPDQPAEVAAQKPFASVAPARGEPPAAPQEPVALTMVEVDVRANLWEDLEITDVGPDAPLVEAPAVESAPPAPETKAVEPVAAEAQPVARQAVVEASVAPVEELRAPEPAPVVQDLPIAALEIVESLADVAEPEPLIDAEPEPPVAAEPEQPVAIEAEAPIAAEPEAPPRPAPSSLGQAALESGLVAAAPGKYAHVLAPIRRMSQAEKIAFFS